jgi:hypothetical protein
VCNELKLYLERGPGKPPASIAWQLVYILSRKVSQRKVSQMVSITNLQTYCRVTNLPSCCFVICTAYILTVTSYIRPVITQKKVLNYVLFNRCSLVRETANKPYHCLCSALAVLVVPILSLKIIRLNDLQPLNKRPKFNAKNTQRKGKLQPALPTAVKTAVPREIARFSPHARNVPRV